MKDQHTKIKGYRDLTQEEIDLMNEGKHLAELCRVYCEKVKIFPAKSEHSSAMQEKMNAIDQRWLSIGMTDLQKGFMAIIRSIAQPTTF